MHENATPDTVNGQRVKLETMARQISQPSPELMVIREQLVAAQAEGRELRQQHGSTGDKMVCCICNPVYQYTVVQLPL